MKKIILDTNFLLIPYQFKLDIFSEIQRIANFKYSINILDKTLDELNKIISTQKGKNKLAALLALELINKKGIKVIKTKENLIVDDLIVNLTGSKPENYIVATQDSMLKSRLKELGVQVIFMKGKSHLAFS